MRDNQLNINRTKRDPHHSHHFRMPHSIPRGLLRYLIIKTLQSKEMTGAEITQTFEKRSKGVWKPSPGSIYPLLAALKEDGLIKPVSEEGRSITYQLTEEGEAHLKGIHQEKGTLAHKARLGRMLWLQLLDPVDQIHFHMIAFETGVEFLTQLVDTLTPTERESLRNHIEKIIENLSTLLTALT